MRLNPREYLTHLERQGLFSSASPIPEHNTDVWKVYLELYDAHVGASQDTEIIVTPEGLGLYRDPLDDRGIYTWALSGPICHPILPFSPVQLLERASSIFETFERDGITEPSIVSETFEVLDGAEPGWETHFVWLNSPRARIPGDFAAYTSSLSSSRRHEMRRLFDSFSESEGFVFEFTDRCPGTQELDFILKNLALRWGADDLAFALVQSLWMIAVSTRMPERARYMRVYYKGQLAFLNGFILRDEVIIAQSTCKNEELRVSGLGTVIDFQAIRMLCGSHIRYLDPTCRTSVIETGSIEVAKRKVVNDDACKPVFLAGYRLPALDAAYAHLDPVRGWIIPEIHTVVGKPA